MKKIKILFPYTGETLGGSHISSILLSQNLPKKKYESIIFVHKKGILTDYLDKNKIKWITHKKANNFFKGNFIEILLLFFKYKAILKYLKVDIVHTHDTAMHLTWIFPCKILNTKHIWHQRAKIGWIIYFSNISSYLICVSNFVRNKLY